MEEYHFNNKEMKMKRILAFLKEEEGASLIEYVLLAALIGVAAILGMTAVGTQAESKLQESAGHMAS